MDALTFQLDFLASGAASRRPNHASARGRQNDSGRGTDRPGVNLISPQSRFPKSSGLPWRPGGSAAPRAGKGPRWLPRSAPGVINRVTVFREPVAHLLQTFGLSRLDSPVRHGADVEQQAAIAAGAQHEGLQTLLERLHLVSGFQAHCWQPSRRRPPPGVEVCRVEFLEKLS